MQRGPGAGSRFLLDLDVVQAGRHPDSEIFLDDVTVSRRHAEFHRSGTSFSVRDAGSLNGTYVNRDRIDSVGLRDGDEVQIGKYRLVFFSGPRAVGRGAPRRRPSGPSAASTSSGRARFNIGQVLDQLRPDFPGVTIPKIRFLEDKGLIKPERTPAGYRKFSADDVDRLRYVLRMQRDHYLPLKVIGEHLDAIDRGLEPPPIESVVPTVPTVALAGDGLPSAASFAARSDMRLSRRELVKIAEISPELLDQLEQFGLISAAPGHRSLRRRRAGDRHHRAGAGRLRLRAAAPACVQDRRRPRGRAGRAGRRPAAARPGRLGQGPRRRRRRARSRRCRCGCTPPWSSRACAAPDAPARRAYRPRPRE